MEWDKWSNAARGIARMKNSRRKGGLGKGKKKPPIIIPPTTAFWKFEETSGTTAFDEEGAYDLTYGAGVTLGSASLLPAFPSTFSVTGGGSAAVASANNDLNPGAGGFSVEAWVNATTVQQRSGTYVIPAVQKFNNSASGSSFALRAIGTSTTTTKWEFVTTLGNRTILSQAQSTENVSLSTTYYVVGVMETDGSTKLYVDGILKATGPAAALPPNPTSFFSVGQIFQGGLFLNLVGRIDEARIFNGVLAPETILETYNTGIGA